MMNRFQAVLILSILVWMPPSTFADSPALPKPYLLESADGSLRFVMLPRASYSLELDNQIYKKSGLYKADDATTPLWTIDWYSFSVYLSDDGHYLVRPGGWAGSFREPAVTFYKDGVAIREVTIRELLKDESSVFRTVSHFFWRRGTAFYPSKNYYEIETSERARFLFDITTGEALGVEQPALPIIAAYITTTQRKRREVLGLRRCLNPIALATPFERGSDASFFGFLTVDTVQEGTQLGDNTIVQHLTGISVPFPNLKSARQLVKRREGEAKFRLKTKNGEQLDVTVLSIEELCGSYVGGDGFRLSLADIQSIDRIQQLGGKIEAPAEGRLKELLRNAQEGHAWKKVSSVRVIVDRNHRRARRPR